METSIPSFVDFQFVFKESLESIKGTVYASLFEGVFPNVSLCIGEQVSFQPVSNWYDGACCTKNSTLLNPTRPTQQCDEYQRECLVNTNWTAVNSWARENNSIDLRQFCPKPVLTSTSATSRSQEPWNFLSPTSPRFLSAQAENGSSTFGQSIISTPTSGITFNVFSTGDENLSSKIGNVTNDSFKYLAILSLLVPVIVICVGIVICAKKLFKKRQRRKVGAAPADIDDFGKMASTPNLPSFPSTPTSTKELIRPDSNEAQKQKATKKRGRKKMVPRQLSTDSNGSTVYFVNVDTSAPSSLSRKSEEGYDYDYDNHHQPDDPDKEKIKEDWKEKLDMLASMLTTSDGNVNLTLSDRAGGQADC